MTQRPLRADAEMRRRHILEAAGRVFLDEGIDAPLERVAREAGVGIGTLYRRFPDRTSLLIGVLNEGARRLADEVRTVLDEGTGWDALVHVLAHPARTIVLRPQIEAREALRSAVDADPETLEQRARLFELLAEVVARAQAEGSVRPDIGPGDVGLFIGMLRRRPPVSGEEAELATRRLRALILDALAAGPRADLPGHPLTLEDIRRARR